MKLIAGEKGLSNNIRWVYFWDTVEIEDCTKWIENNELIISTGSHIASNLEILPNYFPELVKKHLAGIIFSIGPFIKEIPTSIIESANKYNLPIFVVPWEVAIIKFSREICNTIILEEQKDITKQDFVKELVLADNRSEEDLLKFVNRANLTIDDEYRVGVLTFNNIGNSTDEYNFIRMASVYFYNMHFQMTTSIIENHFVFIFKNKHVNSGSFEEEIAHFINSDNNYIDCYIGVGSICHSAFDFHTSYKQALKLANICLQTKSPGIRYYEQCDLNGLLNFAEDNNYRQLYYEHYLKPIVDYDKSHKSNLEETLYTFIDCNLSYLNAADKMYVHKNTLRYRIEKIEELLNLKLDSSETISNILIAKRIATFLDNN